MMLRWFLALPIASRIVVLDAVALAVWAVAYALGMR